MKAIMLPLLAFLSIAAAMECDRGDIACGTNTKCIPVRYICDGDNDCGDSSDEDFELCNQWGDDECSKNQVNCTRLGKSNCIDIPSYCGSEDPPCEGRLDTRVCSMVDSGKLQSLDNFTIAEPVVVRKVINTTEGLADRFRYLIPFTLRHPDCPPMYTKIGDQCLSVFHIGSMSWAEARSFCQILGGDLMTFRNATQYSVVAQHLQQYALTSDFWIGGRIENLNQGWSWIDGSPMELGSPIWATRYSGQCVERNVTVAESEKVCYHYYQAPETETKGQCASLSFEQFFYMSDEDCVRKMSPLCVYGGEEKKSKLN